MDISWLFKLPLCESCGDGKCRMFACDKVLHFLGHFAWTFTSSWFIGASGAVYGSEGWGLLTEFAQVRYMNAHFCWKDLIANNLGMICGLLCRILVIKYGRLYL